MCSSTSQHDRCYIEPALGCPDVSEVSDPLPVRGGRMELPVQNIRSNGVDHGSVRNLVCGAIVKKAKGACYGDQEGSAGRAFGWS